MNKTVNPLSLKKNFSWTLLGNVVYNFCQWGILCCLNKLGNTTLSGEFIWGLAIATPTFSLLNFGLRQILATDVESKYPFECYFGLRIICLSIGILVVSLLGGLCSDNFRFTLIIIISGTAYAMQSLGEVFYGLFQKYERLDIVSHSLIMKGLLNFFLVLLFFGLTKSVLIVVIILTVSRFCIWLFYDYPQAVRLLNFARGESSHADQKTRYSITPSYKRQMILPLTAMGLSLGITTFFVSMNTNIPRYFLNSQELGIYGSMAYITVAGWMIVQALAQSASARIAKTYRSGNVYKYLILQTKLFLFGLSLGMTFLLLVYFMGPTMLTLLYNEEFAAYNNLFIVIILSAMLSYISIFLWQGITAARIIFIQPFIYFFIALSVLITSYLLIPKYNFYGAAYSMIVASTINFVAAILLTFAVVCKMKRGTVTNPAL